MVNKIDGSNNYVYTKQKKIDIPDTGEKFSLDYKNGGLSSETKDKKELSDQEKQQSVERGGVRLELSVGAQTADGGRQTRADKEKAQSESGQIPLIETIRSYVITVIAAVQEFFYKIWNDQPTGEMQAEAVDADEILAETVDAEEILVETPDANEMLEKTLNADKIQAETDDVEEIVDNSDQELAFSAEMDPGRLDREIQQSLRDGDVDQAISLLTDNGRRTIAKNSTLLTSYDKNGRVVEPGASVRERALHGDRNTWKL